MTQEILAPHVDMLLGCSLSSPTHDCVSPSAVIIGKNHSLSINFTTHFDHFSHFFSVATLKTYGIFWYV